LEKRQASIATTAADIGEKASLLVLPVEIERTIANLMLRTEESTGQKIFLPWRPNEPRFAPQQYYYAASKSGVVPSWVISAAADPA
jgi:hypothetical protein